MIDDRGAARLPRDGGSMAVELAFIMPVLLLMVALLFGYGRVAQVNGALEAGTRDAARAASQARTLVEAERAAERAVVSSLGGTAAECGGGKPTVELLGRATQFSPGSSVTVRATCVYPLADVLPGAPGEANVSSTFTSPLDPNRGLNPAGVAP